MEPYPKSGSRLRAIFGSLILTTLMVIILVRVTLGSPAAQQPVAEPVEPGMPTPSFAEGVESPTITSIDSPSATCYLPAPGSGACYIEWNYLYVAAGSGAYVISMTVAIDGRLRAYHSGFFQSSFYIPADMTRPGYKVTCGWPGSGAAAVWGNTYSYVIRARDTAGLSAANYGSVSCPADIVKVYLPVLQR